MTSELSDDRVARGYRRLFEPLSIGDFTIRNRIVNPTHGTGLREERDLRYLQERARGGAGLLGLHGSQGVLNYAVGPTPSSSSPDWDQQLISPITDAGVAFYDDTVIPYMARRAEVVHREGAKCFAQVYHLGAASHAQRITPPIAPSAVPDPYDALTPHPLTPDQIEEVIFAFAQGVRRVRDAGMDAAEIHGGHGYLVNEFLSPYFNRREDEWGGELDNRLRFLRRIISGARDLVGDFPIGLRIGVDGDGAHRGITVEGLAEIAQAISGDVEYISVTGGNYAGFGQGHELAYVSPWYREPGFNAAAAAAVRNVVDVPVLVTGRIADAAVAEGILADGAADMVGMVRALIADPELPNKTRRGEVGEVRMCLGLSECHYIGPHRTPLTCAVNASAARETEMDLVLTERPRTVVVVGAGPAGMEAALVARQRGHTVLLCDESREIGGTPRVLANDPNRRNLRDHAVFFDVQLKRLGVQLMLGNRVSADDLIAFAPDVVVVATGGLPLIPDVPGIHGPHVVTAIDVLSGTAVVGPRALVVGGLDNHIAAPTIAEFLADQGVEVECLSEHVDFASGSEDGTRLELLHRLMNKDVRLSMRHRLVSADHDSVLVEETFTGRRRSMTDVTVVLACGLVPDDRLAGELRGHVPEVHVIGDALAPRRLMHATLEGARVGRLV